MTIYSYSQIQTYITCPRKYRYQYIDKVKTGSDPTSPDQLLGKAIHAAFERMYNKLNVFIVPTLTEVIDKFVFQLEAGWDEDTMSEYQQESYSNRGKAYLSMYWQRYAPFTQVSVLGNELHVKFTLDDAGQYTWKGIIDRLEKHGETMVIMDYKTGKNLSEQQRNEHIEQLTLYAHGVMQKYPGVAKRIEATIFYLHFDHAHTWEITTEQINAVREKYQDLVTRIEQARFAYQMGDQAPFKPIQNAGCTWCKFRHLCPLWKHLYGEEAVEDDVSLASLQSLVDTYARNQAQMRELEKENDALKASFLSYARRHDMRVLAGSEFELTFSVTPTYKITNEELLTASLRQQGKLEEFLQIDRFALARACKDQLLDAGTLHDSVEQEMQWSVRTRAKKHLP